MEIRTQAPTQEQSSIVERVARIVSRVRGAKPDYARLAAELEPAIPFDVFGRFMGCALSSASLQRLDG